MELQPYLDRVKFEGVPRPDLDTLTRLHRGHVDNIPYENLDVQFARNVTRRPADIFDKLVTRRRGGWCYEMNGLLSWALEEIGFDITHMAGAVMREVRGDWAIGNHLVLLVQLDRPYIADVGFGDGLVEPVPLAEGAISQRRLSFRLENLGQGWWRFHNSPGGGARSFDFEIRRADEALLDERCAWLQTNAESPFVQSAVVQRHAPEGLSIMRGRVLKTMGEELVTRNIASATDYVDALAHVFGLTLPEAVRLWPKIEARHREVFGEA